MNLGLQGVYGFAIILDWPPVVIGTDGQLRCFLHDGGYAQSDALTCNWLLFLSRSVLVPVIITSVQSLSNPLSGISSMGSQEPAMFCQDFHFNIQFWH